MNNTNPRDEQVPPHVTTPSTTSLPAAKHPVVDALETVMNYTFLVPHFVPDLFVGTYAGSDFARKLDHGGDRALAFVTFNLVDRLANGNLELIHDYTNRYESNEYLGLMFDLCHRHLKNTTPTYPLPVTMANNDLTDATKGDRMEALFAQIVYEQDFSLKPLMQVFDTLHTKVQATLMVRHAPTRLAQRYLLPARHLIAPPADMPIKANPEPEPVAKPKPAAVVPLKRKVLSLPQRPTPQREAAE